MKLKLRRVASLVSALTILGLASAWCTEDQGEARTWLQRAAALHDLRAPGAPGFRLAMDLKFREAPKGAPASGHALNWLDAGNWAEELLLPGHRERRGREDGIPWELADEATPSGLAAEVASLLHPVELLRRELEGDELMAPRTHAVDASLTEVRVSVEGRKNTHSLLFNTLSGAFVGFDDGQGLVFEYQRFMPLGPASSAAKMTLKRDGVWLVKASLRNARPLREPSLGEFSPPAR